MDQDDCIYRFRVGNKPRFEVLYVYLLIGGKIRYRANLVSYDPPGYFISNAGNSLWGNCWIVICGPLVRAPEIIRRKGFQGFRYTEELF